MSVVAAAAMTLDEQKTILKTCAGDHNIPDNIDDENHILHKLKTATAPSSAASVAAIDGGSSNSTVLPPASPQITINNSSPTSATETSYTAQHRRLLEGI